MKKLNKKIPVAKKPLTVVKKSVAVKPVVRFSVDIPDKDLENLIKLNAAKAFSDTARELKEFCSVFPLPRIVGDSLEALAANCESVGFVLNVLQQGFSKNAKKPTMPKKGEQPVKIGKPIASVKPTATYVKLSRLEKSRIKEFRSNGLSIKEIAKELHRSDRPVAAYVKTIEKKGKKR